jgi:hypothetical protein
MFTAASLKTIDGEKLIPDVGFVLVLRVRFGEEMGRRV